MKKSKIHNVLKKMTTLKMSSRKYPIFRIVWKKCQYLW